MRLLVAILLLCSTAFAADPITITTDGPATVVVTPADPVITVAPPGVSVTPIPADHSRPLPVFASWNMGKNQTADGQDVGYTPDWQHEQLLAGFPILLTFEHSFYLDPNHRTNSAVEFNPAWPYARDNKLPIAFIGWNFLDRLRLGQWPGSTPLPADHPFVVKSDNTVVKACSPWSPNIHQWYAEGQRVGNHLRLVYAADYPEPPAVLLFDNHEAGIATLEQAQQDKRRPAIINAVWSQYWQTNPSYAREVERVEMERAYALRYAEFKRGLREALPPAWRKVLRFIAYSQFGNEFGSVEYTPDSMRYAVPWSSAAGEGINPTHDGIAANVGYLHDWYTGNVGLVRSPSMEAGNVRFAIDTMREVNPAYEVVSLYWNGKQVSAAQYLGMCRCVLWQTQTPIHMAWVGSAETRAATFANQIQPLMQAVQEVHTNETLRRFWKDGKLLRNLWTRDFSAQPAVNQYDTRTGYGHPYWWMLPTEYADTGKRLFLQHVPINQRLVPWNTIGGPDARLRDRWADDRTHQTQVPVFSIAHQLDDEYLVYAHAPNGARTGVQIDVHATTARTFTMTVDVPVAGAFWLRKADGSIEQVN